MAKPNVGDLIPLVTEEEFDEHKAEKATTTKQGHVQLSTSTTSASTATAATSSAVKTAMDRANEAFQSASDGKQLVGTAITGVDENVIVPTNPTFEQLADCIGQISTGKKWAEGSTVSQEVRYWDGERTQYCYAVTVSGLNFRPTKIMWWLDTLGPNPNDLTLNFGIMTDLGDMHGSLGYCARYAWSAGVGGIDSRNSYINDGGFRTEVFGEGHVYKWIAYE